MPGWAVVCGGDGGVLSVSHGITHTLFIIGVVLLEVAYRLAGSGLDVVGAAFVVVALAQGVSVFGLSRVYRRRIWLKARDTLVELSLASVTSLYTSQPTRTAQAVAGETAHKLDLEVDKVLEVDGFFQAEHAARGRTLSLSGLLAFSAGQLVPIIALVFSHADIRAFLGFVSHLVGQ
jgi:VIT1/CCC1 family predicted Fe2+/Mn2+ transporter